MEKIHSQTSASTCELWSSECTFTFHHHLLMRRHLRSLFTKRRQRPQPTITLKQLRVLLMKTKLPHTCSSPSERFVLRVMSFRLCKPQNIPACCWTDIGGWFFLSMIDGVWSCLTVCIVSLFSRRGRDCRWIAILRIQWAFVCPQSTATQLFHTVIGFLHESSAYWRWRAALHCSPLALLSITQLNETHFLAPNYSQ